MLEGGRRTAARQRRSRRRRTILLALGVVAVLVVVGVGAYAVTRSDPEAARTSVPTRATTPTVPETTTTTKPPYTGWVDPASAFQPYYKATTVGLLTFRGNPTRSYYGHGPVPVAPHAVWQYPGERMCSLSEDRGETTNWCGTGWTGEPAVFERDGRTWVVFGAYDRAVHFVDAATGEDILPPFPTGDIIKGSVTVDPDGFPLVYSGSRDGYYRVLAIDRPEATELWKLVGDRRVADEVERRLGRQRARAPRLPVRGRREQPDARGQAEPRHRRRRARHRRARAGVEHARMGRRAPARTPAPRCRSRARSRSPATRCTSRTRAVSCRAGTSRRCSPAATPTRMFRFWTGDDTDGSIVVDEAGMLYGGSEWERHNAAGRDGRARCWKLEPGRARRAARVVAEGRRGGQGRRVQHARARGRPRDLHDVLGPGDRRRPRRRARSAGRSA